MNTSRGIPPPKWRCAEAKKKIVPKKDVKMTLNEAINDAIVV